MPILEQPLSDSARSALFANAPAELFDELELAMRLDQIEVRFQPQFASNDDSVVGAEALLRWQHPTFGEIGAGELFALAAKAGMAEELARDAFGRALRLAGDWPAELKLSVNVTPKLLLSDGFAEFLNHQIGSSRVVANQVTLEITEQILLDDLDLAARRLAMLREMGVWIALDDFGAGYCNFDYLKRLPLDALKLDRSMVQGIGGCERDLAVFRAMVSLAHALDLIVIAEGIETQEQRQAIVNEGCAYWQGFLGSEPLTREAFSDLARI